IHSKSPVIIEIAGLFRCSVAPTRSAVLQVEYAAQHGVEFDRPLHHDVMAGIEGQMANVIAGSPNEAGRHHRLAERGALTRDEGEPGQVEHPEVIDSGALDDARRTVMAPDPALLVGAETAMTHKVSQPVGPVVARRFIREGG